MPTLNDHKNKVRELSQKGLDITADTSLTFAEQKSALDKIEPEIKGHLDEIKALEYVEEKRASFLKGAGAATGSDAAGDNSGNEGLKSLGQQFVDSSGYKGMVGGGLKGNFSSGDIALKTTLTEGTAGTPGPGYNPVAAVPNLQPGVVDIKFRKLTIADLFPAGSTETNLIRYLVETSVTNAAGTVPESGLYPESAIAFSKVDEVLKKVATFLPVSDEMLEDWAQTRSYIDARLQLFIKLSEETQLLSGDGTGSNLVGLLNRPGLATSVAKGTAPSVASDTAMDAIYRQITQIRVTSFMEPDSIVIDPNGWQNILLAKNSQGFYYANGPFASAEDPMLWGKRVVATPALANTTAIVGAFQQAGQIFRKGGITVEASNSHNDFFQRGQTAIRAEERLGLAIYRPGAFGTVTNLV